MLNITYSVTSSPLCNLQLTAGKAGVTLIPTVARASSFRSKEAHVQQRSV